MNRNWFILRITGPRNWHNRSVSGPENWENVSDFGPRNWHSGWKILYISSKVSFNNPAKLVNDYKFRQLFYKLYSTLFKCNFQQLFILWGRGIILYKFSNRQLLTNDCRLQGLISHQTQHCTTKDNYHQQYLMFIVLLGIVELIPEDLTFFGEKKKITKQGYPIGWYNLPKPWHERKKCCF